MSPCFTNPGILVIAIFFHLVIILITAIMGGYNVRS